MIDSSSQCVFEKQTRQIKLLYLVTEGSYFLSHRLMLAREAKLQGFDVIVATRSGEAKESILREGFRLLPIRLKRESRNPWNEFLALIELIGIYRKENPDIVHHVALKPVLYGSLAARFTHVPGIVNAIAGMGSLFIAQGRKAILMQNLVKIAYRWLFNSKVSRIIVQNPDDRNFFLQKKILQSDRIVLIRGSGVDLKTYCPQPEPDGLPLIILPARMLWDKGIGEFVEAARLIKVQGVYARFALVGDEDPANPAAIPRWQLEMWHDSGVVEWWGRREDMPQVHGMSHIVCLPSYREGLPKSLLEAAASARPIVATDVPGCREIVIDSENGILVPVRDAVKLSQALLRLIGNSELRTQMGIAGRQLVEREFSSDRISSETIGVYRELLQATRNQ